MKRIWLILCFFLSLNTYVQAQGYSLFDSQFFFKRFIFNPAYAGSEEGISGWYNLRTSQEAMPGRPVQMVMSVDAPIGKLAGGGVIAEYSSAGSFSRYRFSGSYSYKLNVENHEIYLGLNVGTFTQKFDVSKAGNDDATLQVLSGYQDLPTSIEAAAGATYVFKGLELGFSLSALKKSTFNGAASIYEKPWLVLNGSYDFVFDSGDGTVHIVSPIITYLNYKGYQNQLLIGSEYSFSDALHFYLLTNFVNKGFSAGLQYVNHQRYKLLLGYSVNAGRVVQNFGGSAEIGLGIILDRKVYETE